MKLILSIIYSISISLAVGQLNFTANSNTTQLVNEFMGQGITLSGNPTKYCNSNGTGLFINGLSTNCPIDSGIILCTGYASFIDRSVSFAANAGLNYGMNDADLLSLSPYSNTDICYLEFDFIPSDDSLIFEYVFGSEEYLEWVGSVFNDVFGFFLTGPDPNGGSYSKLNLAKVPGSNDIVSINTINHLSNSTYYINNYPDGNVAGVNDPNFCLDGFTQNLQIGVAVIPGSTYTIKLAIGDVSDPMLDSYVLLKRSSFRSQSSTTLLGSSNLDRFNIKKINNSIALEWNHDAAEVLEAFIIQHSPDGIDWMDYDEITANNSQHSYAAVLHEVFKGWNYVRLKMMDINNNVHFSNVKSIFFDQVEKVDVFPSISNGDIIHLDLSRLDKNAKIYWYNNQALLVKEMNCTNALHHISVADLPRGSYHIKIQNKEISFNTTIVLY